MDLNEHWTAYLLALFAGLIYAGGAITGKKALELGCGQVRVVIWSNLIWLWRQRQVTWSHD